MTDAMAASSEGEAAIVLWVGPWATTPGKSVDLVTPEVIDPRLPTPPSKPSIGCTNWPTPLVNGGMNARSPQNALLHLGNSC